MHDERCSSVRTHAAQTHVMCDVREHRVRVWRTAEPLAAALSESAPIILRARTATRTAGGFYYNDSMANGVFDVWLRRRRQAATTADIRVDGAAAAAANRTSSTLLKRTRSSIMNRASRVAPKVVVADTMSSELSHSAARTMKQRAAAAAAGRGTSTLSLSDARMPNPFQCAAGDDDDGLVHAYIDIAINGCGG